MNYSTNIYNTPKNTCSLLISLHEKKFILYYSFYIIEIKFFDKKLSTVLFSLQILHKRQPLLQVLIKINK